MMDFDSLIAEYKNDQTDISSPIWIWFTKKEQKDVSCKICHATVKRKDYLTGAMTQHLQRHHHFLSKYNAWKIFEELSSIKQERMNNRKRKNTFTEGENPKKQLKMTDVTKFSRDDPRQTKITNSIASMVCADGIPTNIVNRPGFHIMNQCPYKSVFYRSFFFLSH